MRVSFDSFHTDVSLQHEISQPHRRINFMKFLSSYLPLSDCVLLVLLIVAPTAVCLAAEDAAENSADAPVYLDESPQPPPPRGVRHQKRIQKYRDETVRLEYQVLLMSDDTLVNDGTYIEYYRDGQKFQEGTFKHGAYDGQWTYWHPNGQICKSITFKNGRPDGQWEVFRSDGTRRATQGYEDGVRHGKWLSYYENGEQPMVQFTFDHGKINGTRVSYYENGQIKQEIHYQDNKMHGLMTEYDESGKKTAEAMFEKGKLKGTITRY